MTGGIGLVVTLIVMGGAIAFLGNGIGRHIGRSRLSLFGLRPKHSSAVMTVVTGMLIAGCSLALLTVVSRDVRTALFNIHELRLDLVEAERAVAQVAAARDAALAETESLREAAARSRESVLQAESRLEDVGRQLLEAEAEIEAGRREITRLSELTRQWHDEAEKMARSEAAMRQEITRLTGEHRVLEQSLRSGAWLFSKGDVVAGRVVNGYGGRLPGANGAEDDLNALSEPTRQLVEHLLAEGQAYVDEHFSREGGSAGSPHQVGRVRLADDDGLQVADEVLSADGGQWVVHMVVTQNTLPGEDVLVRPALFPRRLLFREGEVIGRRVVAAEESAVEAALMSLMAEVDAQARRGGVLPASDGEAAALQEDAFVDTVVALRRAAHDVVVEAVAMSDSWNTDGTVRYTFIVRDDTTAD